MISLLWVFSLLLVATAAVTPSSSPTLATAPSPAPTYRPTNEQATHAPTAPDLLKFSVVQELRGMTIDEYESDEKNEDTLTEAISRTMGGIDPEHIHKLQLEAASADGDGDVEESVLEASYVIRVYDRTLSYQQLRDDLVTSVEDGLFNEFLHDLAIEEGTFVLVNVTSNEVHTKLIHDDNADDNGDDDASLITPEVVLVIIIVLTVSGVVLALLGCFVIDQYYRIVDRMRQMQSRSLLSNMDEESDEEDSADDAEGLEQDDAEDSDEGVVYDEDEQIELSNIRLQRMEMNENP